MDARPVTCELVDELDLDARYLANRLSEDDAAAFEAHFFGCDRCWALVKGGVAVRAGGPAEPPAAVGRVAERPRAPVRWWRTLALAAGLGGLAFGVWRATAPENGTAPDAIRGSGDSILLTVERTTAEWRAAWSPVEAATRYRVRVYATDGGIRLEREVTETSIAGRVDSLGAGAPFYLDVEAIDRMRRPVARSPLTRLPAPGDST
jgi:hypothetical protein